MLVNGHIIACPLASTILDVNSNFFLDKATVLVTVDTNNINVWHFHNFPMGLSDNNLEQTIVNDLSIVALTKIVINRQKPIAMVGNEFTGNKKLLNA